MCNGSYHQSPPTLLHNIEVLRPDTSKPNPVSDPRVLQLVQVGISDIQNQTALTSLSGWVYYHSFRFLHTIRPKKFPLIKSLEFSGLVKLHTCRWGVCKGKCDDDLVLSLELYIPVISSLLPNVEKVIIHTREDPLQQISNTAIHQMRAMTMMRKRMTQKTLQVSKAASKRYSRTRFEDFPQSRT